LRCSAARAETANGDANADPKRVEVIEKIRDTFNKVGKGEISPGQADAALRKALPNIPDVSLEKATRMVDANLEASVKYRTPIPADDLARSTGADAGPKPAVSGDDAIKAPAQPSSARRAFGHATDAATINHYYQQNLDAGLTHVEALGVATGQTFAGNAAIASGIADPRSAMAGSDVAMESMSSFQQEVAAGQHGVALQGLDHVISSASNLVNDPSTTVGGFVNDVRDIYEHGVGDGYWQESLTHTQQVIEKTPLVGTVVSGYKAAYQEGLGGIAEGAWALGGEGIDAVGNAASSAANYLRSFF